MYHLSADFSYIHSGADVTLLLPVLYTDYLVEHTTHSTGRNTDSGELPCRAPHRFYATPKVGKHVAAAQLPQNYVGNWVTHSM